MYTYKPMIVYQFSRIWNSSAGMYITSNDNTTINPNLTAINVYCNRGYLFYSIRNGSNFLDINCIDFINNMTTISPNTEPGENIYRQPWWLQLIYAIAFGGIVVVAAGGNIIVMWIVLAHKRMRTVTNYFLVNLSVADTLVSTFNVVFNFIFMLNSDWPFGKGYCTFSNFIATMSIAASVFTLMAISIDRYIAIIHPMRQRMSKNLTTGIIGCIWIAASLISLPTLLYSNIYTFYYTDSPPRTICYLQWPDGPTSLSPTDFMYNIFIMIVTYFLPISALAITYTRVGLELWGSQSIGENTPRQMENVKSKKKVVKMMIIVVLIFGICWLPFHAYFILIHHHPDIPQSKYTQHVYLGIYWLAMSNSMYNPMIYCWMNSRFRKGFKLVFRWCPCVKWKPSDTLRRVPGMSNRYSVSDTSRIDRNGSLVHTVLDSLDDSAGSGASFRPIREEDESQI